MDAFFERPQYIRHFPSGEDSLIKTIGYDNFNTVKPLRVFRMQSFYTWHFVLSGVGYLEMGGCRFRIGKGQMFFIPPGEKMCYYPDDDEPWEYVWFSLVGSQSAYYGDMLGFSVSEPVKPILYINGVKSRLYKLFQTLELGEGSVFSVLSAFYAILELSTAESPTTGIHAVKKYIDESFALPAFSVDQLCMDAGFSHAHLLRLFRKAYGITVVKYVIRKRMELACELLTTTDLSVKSIAFSCGFTDEQHFMKMFKREIGSTALQYRKANTK